MMSKLKLGISGLSPQDLSSFTEMLVTNMTDNPNFPSPIIPTVAAIEAKRVNLDNWITKASFGDSRAIHNRRVAYSDLSGMLRQLGSYVSTIADGDATIILSSGFDVRRTNAPQPPIPRPVDLMVNRTEYDGKLALDWKRVKGALLYFLEMTTENPENPAAVWTTVLTTSKSKAEITDTLFGQYYYFRVKAQGVRNESPYSEVAFIRAA